MKSKKPVKVWYGWVQCNGKPVCYQFAQDQAGNITSAKTDDCNCD